MDWVIVGIIVWIIVWACITGIRLLWRAAARWSAELGKPKARKAKPIPSPTVEARTKAANERYQKRLTAVRASMMQEDAKKHGARVAERQHIKEIDDIMKSPLP